MSASNSVSDQKTNQTAYNQQVGADNGSIALGAYSSGNSINIHSDNLDALQSSLDTARSISNNAIASNTVALGNMRDVSLGGLALGSQALDTSAALASGAVGVVNANLDALHTAATLGSDAFAKANETSQLAIGSNATIAAKAIDTTAATSLDMLHSSLGAITNSQAISDSLLQTTIGQFTEVLGNTTNTALQVAANATPQTDQALLERLASGNVTDSATNSATIKFDWSTILTVATVIAVAYYFIKTAK